MESPGVVTSGKQERLLTFKPSLKSLKLLVVAASWSFLVYKLLTFHQYEDLATQWRQLPLSHLGWLAAVFALLPLNWYLEALKWKMLTSGVQHISLTTSIKAVLSGISTGFFTPNRVGELVGRVAFLEPENRKAGITLSAVNSLTQNIIMACCGIPACILFFQYTAGTLKPDLVHFIGLTGIGILITGLIYFTLPRWSRQLKSSRLSGKIKAFTDCLSGYSQKELLQILGVSFTRYVVFCTQFYFMLRFFDIELSIPVALLAIPTNYLFVTFTPSLAFSEAAVRSSYAVLIIGALSGQVVNIALAGVCIWAVNFVIPMLVGSVVVVRKHI
ncbi:MAG: lysylphosphatidylglycerol synthase transmembrane domain-containing protein [Bacteroidota bacterium]|nr:lysylphosphatidylglycerol synthase transmembrane domain-containing protein [Bacteroidota bacterium]